MTIGAAPPQDALARLQRLRSASPWPRIAAVAARIGYMARGAVYLSVGAIALLAALRLSPHAVGAIGALEAWSAWPAGIVLLWAVGLGLYAFAGWRALQSIFDVDARGRRPHALATRVGQAVSGLTYGALALSVFRLIHTLHHLNRPSETAATRSFVARMLDLPLGPWLVIAMGGFVTASGLGSIARAALDHFARGLECHPRLRIWIGVLARAGYAGRGLALLPAGVLLVSAGLHARASEARGLGGALEAVAQRPFGHLVLGVTAVGLIGFGLFAVVEGWLRPMQFADKG
ncbi:MAG: DUF1206 domain-containing protein [Caulobacterales bacterium]|nr:DUF1206 domain-containing protein [Caulobacterales bacterium]